MQSGNYFQACCTGIGSDFVMFSRDEPDLLYSLTMKSAADVSSIELYGGGSGTNNYNDLINKPQINSITLIGNKSLSDLGIQETISDLDTIRSGAAAGATAVQPADLATALATKQDTLSSAQLAAVNSGIDSTKVAQIETNKNNISLIEQLNGAKNYIYYAGTSETITTGGANIQVTNNGDGTFTIDGTAGSSDVYIAITKNSVVPLSLSTGNYVLSGVDTISTNVGMVITPFGAGTQIATLYPPKTSAIVNISTTGNYTCVAKVNKNTTVDHALIKPFLIDKSVWDGGFVDFKQYAMSNAEITAWILAHS